MNRKFSIADIANIAGVSVSTVTRVLKGGDGVSDKKKDAVLNAIRSVDYYPSIIARRIADNNNLSKTVALVIPDMRNPFFADLATRIQDRFLEKGYIVSVFNTLFDSMREKKCLDFLRGCNLKGLIIISSLSDAELKDALISFTCPITLLDRVIDGLECNAVIQDNFQAGYFAAKHLLELGHRSIGFIAGDKCSRSSVNRVEGYKKALEGAFIPVDESKIIYGKMSIERGRNEAIKYLSLPSALKPTAIIMANDETAVGFIDTCNTAGIIIPDDLSIVSFDDISIANLDCFKLTTVRQAISEMSKATMEATLHCIEHPTKGTVHKLLLQPELIIRNSVRAFRRI